jgi:hypothetical protein
MKFNTQSAEWISIRIITCIISLSLLLYNMCNKYDNGGKSILKNNSVHVLVCSYSNTFLRNEFGGVICLSLNKQLVTRQKCFCVLSWH